MDGVSVGANVLLAGIKVGSVTELKYIPDGHRALISMQISNEIKIPTDSVALIITSGMFGGKYIKLDPGGEEEFLKSGSYFEYVQGAVIFEELLQKIVISAEARRLKSKRKNKRNILPESENNVPFGRLLK